MSNDAPNPPPVAPKAAREHSPLETLNHSASHVMAAAVKRLFPGAKVTIGPAIDNGFYYDFDVERPFTEEDLVAIEAEMAKDVKADLEFQREEIDRDQAVEMFRGMGESYKVEIIEGIPAGTTITLYRHGDFVDLCRGPHVDRTSRIKAYKLTNVAGAYWRGDERRQMLQRIYGCAFTDKKALDEHLRKIEEAKKRDHRRLGKDLDLFSIDEDIGGGLVLWHPKGALTRYLIEEFWRREHLASGYDLVNSPHIARENLWQTSGHLGWYKENLYNGMDVDGQQYLVKPMNCPFHITMFKNRLRSYRDLPMRWAELGTVYRYERSGVLHGLLRVRGFTQDDAHLFITKDQLNYEIERVTRFCLHILRSFGFVSFKTYLATRPAKFVGEVPAWDEAEAALKRGLDAIGLDYEMDVGGGAFYGPKIDLKLVDALDREWQCSTIQVDFQLPERFQLEYVAPDGSRQRPIMLHRALLGSIERFFAVLLEHYAGALPLWIAPVQAKVLTVSEKSEEFGREVEEQLRAAGVRVEKDLSSDKLGAKIRRAQLEKAPYMLVIGDKEVAARGVSPRSRDGRQAEMMPIDAFVRQVLDESHPSRS
ncbi:MAG: threonine--tRNA ligase [Deltaproteobacteria bacterium]|nr:threonine--tRNA ligase [Deltaproteobacteria bacterium]